MSYVEDYLEEVHRVVNEIDVDSIEKMIDQLVELRKNGGRLFFLGVGGGAGNATHAVNDFRKIAGIEAYTPIDNVSELSARVNDEGIYGQSSKCLRNCAYCKPANSNSSHGSISGYNLAFNSLSSWDESIRDEMGISEIVNSNYR